MMWKQWNSKTNNVCCKIYPTTFNLFKRIIFIKHLQRTISYPPCIMNFWQSFYHLCQNLSKVSVSRLFETFSTYITVWGALGMQLPHWLSCRQRDRESWVEKCVKTTSLQEQLTKALTSTLLYFFEAKKLQSQTWLIAFIYYFKSRSVF